MAAEIPARRGAHVVLRPSQKIKIINPSGSQVVDFWAFPLGTDQPAWMSMAQTRSTLMKLTLSADDVLVDTRRKPLLKLVEDSSPGIHDMLFPPCDSWRYAEAGRPNHDSCGGNLRRELAQYTASMPEETKNIDAIVELGSAIKRWKWTPEPFNVFMNVPWSGAKGELRVERPNCLEFDSIVLEALVECLIVMSACPNDLLDTNGGSPSSASYTLM